MAATLSADIAELAKVFTGWHVRNDQFFFNSAEHDYDSKTILGSPINGTGLSEGRNDARQAGHAPRHGFTHLRQDGGFTGQRVTQCVNAECLCQCLAVLRRAYRVCGRSLDSFTRIQCRQQFQKQNQTPLELLGPVIRNFSANFSQSAMDTALRNMGMSLFDFPVPTGNSEDSGLDQQ